MQLPLEGGSGEGLSESSAPPLTSSQPSHWKEDDSQQPEEVEEESHEDDSQQEQVKEKGCKEDGSQKIVDEDGSGDAIQTKTTSEPEPTPTPQPVFEDGWSKLSREVIVDKVKGIIYGQAIGDALGRYTTHLHEQEEMTVSSLGLATEFMTQEEAVKYYKKEGPNEYTQIVQDFHRSRQVK